MIAALKLDDLVPSGSASCQPQGRHDRFGTGVHHAYHFDVGHHLNHQFGDLHLALGGSAKGKAVLHSFFHRFPDERMVVTQNHGAPGAHVINVPVAVHVPDICAVCFGNKAGSKPHRTIGADGAVYAAGKYLFSPFKQGRRSVHYPMSPF